jgi:hypothetical protein
VIHHVSIPARDPRHVADVLAELMGGRVYPFPPFWCRDAYQVVSGDPHGTMLEVYPDGLWLEPEEGIFRKAPAAPFHPFHMLVSLPVEAAEIERIAARAGWRNEFTLVGTPGEAPAFRCYRMWIENRVLFEFVPQSMIVEYQNYMQFARLDMARPREVAAAAAA